MQIIKASGEPQAYNQKKLLTSLARSQVPDHLQHQALKYLTNKLHPNITTQELHNHLNTFLSRTHPPSAARYNIKKAIFALGPPGYPFEKYFAAIIAQLGFAIKLNQQITGHCISHEVDILAHKNKRYLMIECKHHSQAGSKSDAKVALYTYARFLDLQEAWNHDSRRKHPLATPWLATNTKLTTDAYQYCQCRKIRITSWNHPHDQRLPALIDRTRLYPVTCLPILTPKTAQPLLDSGLVLCQDLAQLDSLPSSLIPKSLFKAARDQARQLCS